MSTALTWQTESTSLSNTLGLAAAVGQRLKGGEVIELVSDLGGGKTAFVKGLAAGLGIKDTVTSPSFTLGSQYRAGDLSLHHFDFYRLSQPGIMKEELAEVVNEPKTIVVVEWAGIIEDVLPANRLTVRITPTGENSRRLLFEYPSEFEYLIPANT